MHDPTRRDALARHLAARLCDDRRSLDELRVIDVVLSRLEIGADLYGPLDLSKPRDYGREAAEEIVDERFYRACQTLRLRDEHTERLRCELADELARAHPVEYGLRELAANAPQDWPGISELGGEE